MDWITAEHIAQLAVLVAAGWAGWNSWNTSRVTARKEALTVAEDRLAVMEARLGKAERKLDLEVAYRVILLAYVGKLQLLMERAGIPVPPMPEPPTDLEADAK